MSVPTLEAGIRAIWALSDATKGNAVADYHLGVLRDILWRFGGEQANADQQYRYSRHTDGSLHIEHRQPDASWKSVGIFDTPFDYPTNRYVTPEFKP